MFRSAALSILLLPAALLGPLGLPPAAAEPVAQLILPDATGMVSQVIRIPLDIADINGAESGLIKVAFDLTVARPRDDSLELGAFGAQIQALWGANTIADTLVIAFATEEGGYVGSGTLASFEWELVGVGNGPLHFTFINLERDDQGVPVVLPATGDDGSVTASPVAVEASTWGGVKQRFAATAPGGGGALTSRALPSRP